MGEPGLKVVHSTLLFKQASITREFRQGSAKGELWIREERCKSRQGPKSEGRVTNPLLAGHRFVQGSIFLTAKYAKYAKSFPSVFAYFAYFAVVVENRSLPHGLAAV
jgi:hypothetical protein